MENLRHGPLVFWVALSVALIVAVPAVLSQTRPSGADGVVSASQQRHELAELRTHLALLVALARNPDVALAKESAAIADRARDAARRADQRLAAGYLELADELDGLASYTRERFDPGHAASPAEAASQAAHAPDREDGQVRLSQLEPLPPLPDLPPRRELDLAELEPSESPRADAEDVAGRAEVARRLARILALADRLVPLA